MSTVKLASSDGEIFEEKREVAECLGTVKTMLETLGEQPEEPIPLPNVKAAILKKVLEWCRYHADDPPRWVVEENKEKRTDDICSWDVDFLNVDQETLFNLIMAANYLNVKGLVDVTCKAVANMIKGKSTGQIRKTFNIQNDLGPERQVHRENNWSDENSAFSERIS